MDNSQPLYGPLQDKAPTATETGLELLMFYLEVVMIIRILVWVKTMFLCKNTVLSLLNERCIVLLDIVGPNIVNFL